MKIDAVRKAAMALEGMTEEPHYHFSSFRVKGKIFVTIPPEETHIHVFVPEVEREVALATNPSFIEKLLWGGKVVGLRITLANAKPDIVHTLVLQAYTFKSAQPGKKSTKQLGKSSTTQSNVA